MKTHFEVTAISSDKPNLERVGQLQEVPVYHVEMTRQITPFQDLESVWKLYKYFREKTVYSTYPYPKSGDIRDACG
jgi:hypothetical protein